MLVPAFFFHLLPPMLNATRLLAFPAVAKEPHFETEPGARSLQAALASSISVSKYSVVKRCVLDPGDIPTLGSSGPDYALPTWLRN